LAIRELIDTDADCADSRDVAGQMALFTEDTELVVFADSLNPEPTQRFRGRAALAPLFDELKNYRVTMHSMVKSPPGSTALGPRRLPTVRCTNSLSTRRRRAA
jgi:hypothetical protein